MPVVFILTPGFDPTIDLRKLADGSSFEGSKFRHLSLGQGQELVSLVRGKVYLIKHYAMKACGCIDPCILDLGIIWRAVISFTPRPLYHRRKAPGTHWIGG
jgi:hypothetical protein